MKYDLKFLVSCCLVLTANGLFAQDIIPLPKTAQSSGKSFVLNAKTIIRYDGDLEAHAALLSGFLSPATGFDLEIMRAASPADNAIYLDLVDGLPQEAYELDVNEDRVIIKASAAAGIFYGIQTLRQLMPVGIYSRERIKNLEWEISGIHVKDEPEYKWRGMMLDVSRYFFDKDYVMKYIDMMSMYKLNTLHLHLIDDAGWRLEIKKYPKLTSIGAWRGEGAERTGGYYTQDDIREMVAYAAMRNVEIIPEIEVPAHTLAAIAAYPHLSCNEKPVKVQVQHSISRELYCVGKESTFEFLQDVFEEAFQLFPSEYIHIGGDEAKYDRWEKCAHCQKRKQELGLNKEAELQVYFNRRIQEMVKKYGKTIVGWDEIIEEGLEEKAVGMIWHNKKKAFAATAQGHDIVLVLTDHCYFDFPESNIPGEVKAATWMPPISLEKVYRFNPAIEGLDEKYRPQILGGQGALWSDQFIHGTVLQEIAPINENRSEAYFDYLTFPRMAALAEVIWTSRAGQEWNGFEQRMQTHYNRYDHAGYGYRVPQPKLVHKEEHGDGFTIALENIVAGAEIRYSTNGIKPNVYSEIYEKPVRVKRLQDFQAITVVSRKHYSLPLLFPVDYPEFEKYGKFMAEWRAVEVVSEQPVEFERKATGKINKNGTYEVTFLYLDGESDIKVEGLAVYKNNRIFASDKRPGKCGKENRSSTYIFEVDNYETGAEYSIKTKIEGIGGNDSNGVIFIKYKENSD
ncbi:MAG: family 20 glycosylhydrolase [Cytophagales bacterium]|nr:family 20 glycosylhydrolase [Cytophagales bacterium]